MELDVRVSLVVDQILISPILIIRKKDTKMIMKVIEMTVKGRRGYYTGLQSSYNGGWRITNKLEKIPKSGRFFNRYMDWGDDNERSKECWWSTFPNELQFTVKLLTDWSEKYNITDIKVLDVVVQSEKLELTKTELPI